MAQTLKVFTESIHGFNRISDAAAEHANDGDDDCNGLLKTNWVNLAGRWEVLSWIECRLLRDGEFRFVIVAFRKRTLELFCAVCRKLRRSQGKDWGVKNLRRKFEAIRPFLLSYLRLNWTFSAARGCWRLVFEPSRQFDVSSSSWLLMLRGLKKSLMELMRFEAMRVVETQNFQLDFSAKWLKNH